MFKLVAVQRVALKPESVTFSTLPLLVLDTILSYLDRSSLFAVRRLNSQFKEIARYRLTLEMQLDASQTMGLHQDPVEMLFLKPIPFLKHLTVPMRKSFVAMKMLRQANLSEFEIENTLKLNPDALNSFPLVFQMSRLSGALIDDSTFSFCDSKVSGTIPLNTSKYGAIKSFQTSTTHHAVEYQNGVCEIYYSVLYNRKTPELVETISDCKALFSCKHGFLIQSKKSDVFYIFKDRDAQTKSKKSQEIQCAVKVFPLNEAIYVQLSNHNLIDVGMSHFGNITCANSVQSIFSSGRYHFLAVLADHSYVVWGKGYTHPQTQKMPKGRTIESVYWIQMITIALLDDGTPLIWKRNPKDSIVRFPSIPKECAVKKINVSSHSFIAQLDNNELYGWGFTEAEQTRLKECSSKGIQSIYNNQYEYVVLLNNGRVEFIPEPNSSILPVVPQIPNDRFVKAVYPSMHSFLLVLDNHDIEAILVSDRLKPIISALPKGEPIARIICKSDDIFTILYKNNKLIQIWLPQPGFMNTKNTSVYENYVNLDKKKLLRLDNLIKNDCTKNDCTKNDLNSSSTASKPNFWKKFLNYPS